MWMMAIVILALLILAAGFARWAFGKAFYMSSKQKKALDPRHFLGGEQDEFCRAPMLELVDRLEARPHERVCIRSREGLQLSARYYEVPGSDVLEIFFHGWRGTALRDGCGAGNHALDVGHSLLLVDQRAHGESEGHVISFGIREKYDCLDWVDYAVSRFGPDIRILLGGVSMGAATVLMASALELPDAVCGITADCGYTSPEAIIRKVCRDMGISDKVGYPFVCMSARLLGGFSMRDGGAVEAVGRARVPILIIHGKEDDFVPFSMAEELCRAGEDITLLSVPRAGHGLSFFYDNPGYIQALNDHAARCLSGCGSAKM